MIHCKSKFSFPNAVSNALRRWEAIVIPTTIFTRDNSWHFLASAPSLREDTNCGYKWWQNEQKKLEEKSQLRKPTGKLLTVTTHLFRSVQAFFFNNRFTRRSIRRRHAFDNMFTKLSLETAA